MKIGHVHLKVKNLDRAEDFYRNILGAQQTERLSNHYSFLTMGESHHEIALQEVGEDAKQPTQDMVGLYHTAFEVVDSKELLSIVERLEKLKIDYTLVDHGISWAAYTSDPDGNGVEIYLDTRSLRSGSKHWNGSSRRLSRGEVEAAISI